MMIKQRFYFILFFFLFALGCKQNEKLNDCGLIDCAPSSIELRVKFEDRLTGSDLLFGINSKYKISDINIYSTRLKKNIDFKIDSTNQTQKLIAFSSNSSDEFNVSVSKLKAVVIKVETRLSTDNCCGKLELSSLAINNSNTAFNNSNASIVVIKI